MSDYQFITERGVIVPDTADIRARVIELFQSAFGNDIDTDPSTPSGVLITMFTEQRDAVARNNAALANQINPEQSTGVFLDGLFGFTGGERKPATRSIINGVTLTGDAGTVVPAGTIARTINGDQFASVAQVVLNAGGTATADFIAIEYGPVECGAHELQTIATSVLGLIGIDNTTGAVVGRKAETDSQVRRRRRETLAIQSMSTPEAIRSRLGNIETVRSYQFLENYTDAPVVKRGITLKPHSIWACVEGGTDAEIATALHESKTMGAGYNGAAQYDIIDPRSLVAYPILFDRPSEVALLIRVTVRASSLDAQNLIPDLVMNYVNGDLEGDVSFVVGVDVSPWEIAGAINQQEPLISVQKVELSLAGSSVWSSNVYALDIDQVARTQRSSITVVIV